MRKLLLVIIFFLSGFTASAAVFVVTSNADSGPGTLRQALLDAAANGSTQIDHINFNIADVSEAGRTIQVLSNLPAIISDIVIDGSTQPGLSLSKNGAKVALRLTYIRTYSTEIVGISIKRVNYVEIDGLILTGLYKSFLTDGQYSGVGISIEGSNKGIVLGQPGKGNVLYNFSSAVVTNSPRGEAGTDNITLKNNYIGVKEDGIAIASYLQLQCYLDFVYNLTLGGNSPDEGNVIYGSIEYIPGRQVNYVEKDVTFKIKNNIFCANSIQQRSPDPTVGAGSSGFYMVFSGAAARPANLTSEFDVSDNIFGCSLGITGFTQTNVKIQHNQWGLSWDGINKLPIPSLGLRLASLHGTCLVGGADITKGNVFTNCVQDTAYARGYSTLYVEDPGTTVDPAFKVEITHNSFYCNNNPPVNYGLQYNYNNKPLQPLSVDNLTLTAVNGTAVPNSRVELYYTDFECKNCQPKTYITAVTADAGGKWSYSNALQPGYGIMASATLNQLTSEFTDTRIDYNSSPLAVTGAVCNAGGAITGLHTRNAKQMQWVNVDTHQVVGTSESLTNMPPGKYRLKASQFGCDAYSAIYTIDDASPQAQDFSLKVTNPSCGVAGSIKGLFVLYTTKMVWLDAANNIKGTTPDISGLTAGTYTLQMTGQQNCIKTYGPITLINTSGPNITQTNAIIVPTNCGQSIGSVTNITATGTGTLKYSWKNAQNQQVATTKDLLNQPAGVYTLQVTDDTNCGPVYTSAITIPEVNGITMDETAATQTPVTCAGTPATVSGIKVTGANTYQWFNGQGLVISNTVDLNTGSPGNYRLVVSNVNGCNQTSKVYPIIQQTNTDVYGGLSKVLKEATCGFNNGSIQVLFTDNPAVLPKSYRWVNHSSGTTVATTTSPLLTGIDLGAYDIYVTNNAGCERFLINYSIGRIPGLTVTSGTAIVTDDQCGTGTGSITGIGVSGKTPLNFSWTADNGSLVGTAVNLSKLKAGNYHLKITDGSGCEQLLEYTIRNQNNVLPAPAVSNLQLCGSGDAVLAVSNPLTAISYRLYDTYTSEVPIDEQAAGRFKINVKQGRSYYVSQFVGECESGRVEVKVTVGISTVNIANTFSPNGDDINDTWNISNSQSYPNVNVQIFTRSGQKVFESIGYNVPFDGTYNGKLLPVGTYYYIINLNSGCGLLSGSLTIVR